MQPDITTLHQWYQEPLGQTCAEIIRQRLLEIAPNFTGERLLILGYAEPYLNLWPQEQVVWGMPAAMGGYAWPDEKNCRSALVDTEALPFADQTFDGILLLHALEYNTCDETLLNECYRVLYPAGRLLVVTPNRLGVWARREKTPWASGTPYSSGQLRKLVSNKGFRTVSIQHGLFVPPMESAFIQKRAQLWEKVGRKCASAMGGVVLLEASKDVLGGHIIRVRQNKRMLPPIVRPVATG
ncbi:MAG: methyltransferase domain-containing protein [Alphaproteobacteria bacterium]|nr:methyltransferase domain-containing protein [Alphaproteobacteria bacterium]MDD9920561.1 methyltransferase domain-containing protein [Alphaproteobacteria bacterium]